MIPQIEYHVHSQYSYCSEDVTIEKLAACALRKGISPFFITDHSSHLYFPEDEAWKYEYLKNYSLFRTLSGTNHKRVRNYLYSIRKFSHQGARAGIEMEYTFDGKPIFDEKYLEETELVISGVHHLPCMDEKPTLSKFVKEFLDYTLIILEQEIDILVHPTRVFRRAGFEIPKEVYAPIINKAVSRGIALEINSHRQGDPDEAFVKLALAKKAKIALGTDTHALRAFGDFSWHFDLLRRCGVKEDDLEKVLFDFEKEDK